MIQIVELIEVPTAVVRERVPVEELPDFFSRIFTEVGAELSEQGASPSGPPFALFHGAPDDVADVEAGFPVVRPIQPAGAVRSSCLPGGRAVQAIHVGSYDHVKSTYDVVLDTIQRSGHTPCPLMWETYLNEPGDDPVEAETLVTWPFSD